jgi:hypothetical protein
MTALGVFEFRATLAEGMVHLVLLVVCPFMLWCGVSWLGAALTCFSDAIRSGPVLEITAGGLRDYRSGLSTSWTSVRSARILGTAPAHSVELQLRTPVTNWQNPFRIGIVFHRYRPVPDRIIISAGCLDVPGHVVTHVILTLVKWNGGEAITKVGNAEGQRLIPRASAKPVV